jgi:hypothetical protein
MDDLLRWLGEQLAEDERIALAVRVPPDWHQGPGDDPEWTDAEMVCMWPPEFHTPYEQDKHWRGLKVEGPALAAYIAAHDPARVLREVDAKRQLIRELLEYEAQFDSDRGCGHDADYFASGLHNGHMPKDILGLRLIASGYSHRPGYRDEWRP